MNKNVKVELNLNSLVKALVANAKAEKNQRAWSHKHFQTLIAQSQGFTNFEALKASNQDVLAPSTAPVATAQSVRQGQYIESGADGFITHLIRFNETTGQVLDVVYMGEEEADSRSVRYTDSNGKIQTRYVMMNRYQEPLYVLGSASDVRDALAEKLGLIESGSQWLINGMLVANGMDSDWYAKLEKVFENISNYTLEGNDRIDDLSYILEEITLWSTEFVQSKESIHISVRDLLWAEIKDSSIQIEYPESLVIRIA